jgi:hypothetical protein
MVLILSSDEILQKGYRYSLLDSIAGGDNAFVERQT